MKEVMIRSAITAAIVFTLFPILLGGFQAMTDGYRAQWRAMREEHMQRIRRDRLQREEREARQRLLSGSKPCPFPLPHAGVKHAAGHRP